MFSQTVIANHTFGRRSGRRSAGWGSQDHEQITKIVKRGTSRYRTTDVHPNILLKYHKEYHRLDPALTHENHAPLEKAPQPFASPRAAPSPTATGSNDPQSRGILRMPCRTEVRGALVKAVFSATGGFPPQERHPVRRGLSVADGVLSGGRQRERRGVLNVRMP